MNFHFLLPRDSLVKNRKGLVWLRIEKLSWPLERKKTTLSKCDKKRDFFVHFLSTVFLDSKLAWSSSIYVKVLSLITNTKWFTIEWVSHEMLNIIPSLGNIILQSYFFKLFKSILLPVLGSFFCISQLWLKVVPWRFWIDARGAAVSPKASN